ncbi:hypothetical protein A3Q56_07171 [Intoshia linei]|uniref:Core Histone H2A/H2B/H3 domain-containing protein n=1 Tax=Intoshia linei TaxID=1819745 RepID=A0A177AUN5_9BILA|nr:hypothetical protein A3Q56_07171 [Intoshia linei]
MVFEPTGSSTPIRIPSRFNRHQRSDIMNNDDRRSANDTNIYLHQRTIPNAPKIKKLSKVNKKSIMPNNIGWLHRNAIPMLPFARLVHQITSEITTDYIQYQTDALRILQEVSEIYLTTKFTDLNKCAQHRQRVTISKKDMQLLDFLNDFK